MKKNIVLKVNIFLLLSLPSVNTIAQKIEVKGNGVSINSIFIDNENQITQALGVPDKKISFPDSIRGGYWEYKAIGLTIYFTEKKESKKCDIQISCKNFKGEIFLGKTKLEIQTHLYRLLQIDELFFPPIEISSTMYFQDNFIQSIDAICFEKTIRFIYERLDKLSLISFDLF